MEYSPTRCICKWYSRRWTCCEQNSTYPHLNWWFILHYITNENLFTKIVQDFCLKNHFCFECKECSSLRKYKRWRTLMNCLRRFSERNSHLQGNKIWTLNFHLQMYHFIHYTCISFELDLQTCRFFVTDASLLIYIGECNELENARFLGPSSRVFHQA